MHLENLIIRYSAGNEFRIRGLISDKKSGKIEFQCILWHNNIHGYSMFSLESEKINLIHFCAIQHLNFSSYTWRKKYKGSSVSGRGSRFLATRFYCANFNMNFCFAKNVIAPIFLSANSRRRNTHFMTILVLF